MKQEWKFETKTSALGDTGDHTSSVIFTNGKETLETNGEDMEQEDCEKFVELLNLMPDLWSYRTDKAEFELQQVRSELKDAVRLLDNSSVMLDNATPNKMFDSEERRHRDAVLEFVAEQRARAKTEA